MKIIVMLMTWLVMCVSAYACDICGSSHGGDGWGITPNFNRHFLAARVNWRTFRNSSGSISEGDYQEGHDSFLRLELAGRYAISDRWQIMGVMPYVVNEHYSDAMTHHIHGVGDASLLGQYMLISPGNGFPSHACQLSAGVNVPTGKFRFSHNIPSGIQQGSGSWDLQSGAGYTFRREKFGVQAEVMYRFNSRTRGGYDWGDQLSSALRGFGIVRQPDGSVWMPFVGSSYECAFPDIENLKYDIRAPYTGGEMLIVNSGLEYYGSSTGFGVDAGIPVYCNRAGGSSNMTMQLSGRFIYYFN
ncbi:MAG: hypothetical protein RL220_557 [Bacteroidota bacterium]|jgi:hypothetical protein